MSEAVNRQGARSEAPSDVTMSAREPELPSPLRSIVDSVVHATKLWRSERAEVARELASHFAEGLAAGESAEALADRFGDPRAVARMIRRAKKRQRPAWWRAGMFAFRSVAAFLALCITVYAVLAARVFLLKPAITHNYTRELSAAALSVPESQRAWPKYIQAITQFGPLPEFIIASSDPEPGAPGDANWAQMARWLDEHQSAMQIVRDGAACPVVGVVYRSSTDPAYAQAMQATRPGYTYSPSDERDVDNPLLFGIVMPHLGEMRRFARWVSADAKRSVEIKDSARFHADVAALLGMAQQCLDEKLLISQQVGLAIGTLALQTVRQEFATPGICDDRALQNLAHEVAALGGGRVRIDCASEGIFIRDIVQRFFSDDGHGDGHFIGGGFSREFYEDFGVPRPKMLVLLRAFQPVQSVFLPSRRKLVEMSDAFVAEAARDDALPPWRQAERTSGKAWARVAESGVYTMFPILRALTGGDGQSGIEGAFAARDEFETCRDGTLIAIALESFRRQHGAWPSTLDELVPSFLPSLPLDPFDAAPLRYRPPGAAGELPTVYSVGVDRVDDHGRSPATNKGKQSVHFLRWSLSFEKAGSASAQDRALMDMARGDWVLWPVPVMAKDAEQ